MGKITQKDIDKLPKSEKKKIDKAKKEIAKTMPKVDLNELQFDLNTLGTWIADIDEELREISKLVLKMANRMGFK